MNLVKKADRCLQADINRAYLVPIDLTDSQKALLAKIIHCIDNNVPLTFRDAITIYRDHVRSTIEVNDSTLEYVKTKRTIRKVFISKTKKVDLLEHWDKKADGHLRAQVRAWLSANLGMLIIKNKLIAVPVIEGS